MTYNRKWLYLLVTLKDQCAITWSVYKETDAHHREERERMATINSTFDRIYSDALDCLLPPWDSRVPASDVYIAFGARIVGEFHALCLNGDEEQAFPMMLSYAIAYTLWEGNDPDNESHNALVSLASSEAMQAMTDFCEKYEVMEFDY